MYVDDRYVCLNSSFVMPERDTVLELLHADEVLAEELDVSDGPGHQEPVIAEPAPALAAGDGHEQGDVIREQGEVVHLDIGASDHLIAATRHQHVNIGRGQRGQALKLCLINFEK